MKPNPDRYPIHLTIEELKKILNALGQRPFNEVYELIGNINHQLNEAIDQQQASLTADQSEQKDMEKEN